MATAASLVLAASNLAAQSTGMTMAAPSQTSAAAPMQTTPSANNQEQTQFTNDFSSQAPSTAAPAEAHSPYPHRATHLQSANGEPLPMESVKPPDSGETLHIILGRSVFVNTPEKLRRIYISNPTVIESMTPSPHDVVITAKSLGTSSVVFWDETGDSTVFTVLSDVDIAGLRESLAQALPADRINVEVQGAKLFLSGVVGSDDEADIATRLAADYSKDIVNSLVVDPRHHPQISLRVRFAELDRSKLTSFGVNLFGLNGQNIGSGSTQQFAPPAFQLGQGSSGSSGSSSSGSSSSNSASLQFSNFLNLFYFDVTKGVGASIQDLETKGILEILSEPTLVTLDGQPAKFLAGGEFPFPVIQPSSGTTATVTIQFKPFGVKLDFTPYVNPDGTIRLKIDPEVSALDYSNVVVIAGYTIPSITSRKAETEVELRDGQTFGISGILDRRTTDSLSRMPGIGDVPILGQLFRSKSLNHSVMELVVVVTPTIVDPLTVQEPSPLNPKWVTPPGTLGNFDKNLPKSYNEKQ
jgi:pilus assembly protein CpaC